MKKTYEKKRLSNEGNVVKLTPSDFEAIFCDRLSDYVSGRILEYNCSYREVTDYERDACIKKIVGTLLDQNIVRSGEHRLGQWEDGWNENLEKLTRHKKPEAVIPHYFGKYNIARFRQRFIRPLSKDFEYNMLGVVLDWISDKYFRTAVSIYEFGCGTGHNLFRVRKVNPDANLWGLDWTVASQKIIRKISRDGIDPGFFARRFDYFNPDMDFALDKDAIVYTVASLEQIGGRYNKFVSYLRKNKPKLCVHIEPIAELLDENNLLDYLSIEYFKKRNYLCGFLDYLRTLEKNKKIKIVNAQRTYIGSFFVEGYSVVVWRPL